ncbi:MAG TPA: polymer-forming cytoskeletal protein [Candidatus Acidoferrales bacterium]|nr:polymer-forming cytoskeletal protein [Candidatus Acidoferrales bacterium]
MWNKKREDEPRQPQKLAYTPPAPPPTPAPAPNPIEARKETAPVSSMPPARFEPENRGGAATIGKAVKVSGNIYSREDLYVDGDLDGTVEALEHKLTIGPNGTVKATIKAREVVVLGSIQGNVEATDKIEIRKDARLTGDIRTARIIIEDGAYFKGSIDIVKPEPKPVAKAQQPATPAAAAAPAGTPAHQGAGVEVKR